LIPSDGEAEMDAMLGELGLGEGKLASTLEEEQA